MRIRADAMIDVNCAQDNIEVRRKPYERIEQYHRIDTARESNRDAPAAQPRALERPVHGLVHRISPTGRRLP
jgi:hypothetical protein